MQEHSRTIVPIRPEFVQLLKIRDRLKHLSTTMKKKFMNHLMKSLRETPDLKEIPSQKFTSKLNELSMY